MFPAISLQKPWNARRNPGFSPDLGVWRNRPLGRSALYHIRYLFSDVMSLRTGRIQQTKSRRQFCFVTGECQASAARSIGSFCGKRFCRMSK
jgi:hypothetical protein